MTNGHMRSIHSVSDISDGLTYYCPRYVSMYVYMSENLYLACLKQKSHSRAAVISI